MILFPNRISQHRNNPMRLDVWLVDQVFSDMRDRNTETTEVPARNYCTWWQCYKLLFFV